MLKGFEDITFDLTEKELQVVLPAVLAKLSTHKGVNNSVTNKQIISYLSNRNIKSREPRIRTIINYIRTTHLLPGLLASSKGYHVVENPREILDYIQSLEGRNNEVYRIIKALKDDYKAMIKPEQGKLFSIQ